MSHNEHEQAIRKAHDSNRESGKPHTAEQAAQAVVESRPAQLVDARKQFEELGMSEAEIEDELREIEEAF